MEAIKNVWLMFRGMNIYVEVTIAAFFAYFFVRNMTSMDLKKAVWIPTIVCFVGQLAYTLQSIVARNEKLDLTDIIAEGVMVVFMSFLQAGVASMAYTIAEKNGLVERLSRAFGKKLDEKLGAVENKDAPPSTTAKDLIIVLALSSAVVLSACHKKVVVSDTPTTHKTSVTVAGKPITQPIVPVTEETGILSGEVISLDHIYFSFDSAKLRMDELSSMRSVVEALKYYKTSKVIVEGNCDERGTPEYNKELGSKRASTVSAELIKSGISASRIRLKSNGKEKKICNENTEVCHQANRRVDFILVP